MEDGAVIGDLVDIEEFIFGEVLEFGLWDSWEDVFDFEEEGDESFIGSDFTL